MHKKFKQDVLTFCSNIATYITTNYTVIANNSVVSNISLV